MPGFNNDVVYASNFDFTNATGDNGTMTTDGQLLIGNTAGNPQVNTLTSTDSSTVITNGAGTIDLSSVGVAIDNVLYVGKHGDDGNSGATPSLAKLTINAAVTAASAGDTIIVYPGTYTETITHAANNVTLLAQGKPGTCVITQADANVIDINTQTGIFYNGFKITCTAATSAINTIQLSTGSATFRFCRLWMISSAAIAGASQPAIASVTGAGMLIVAFGRHEYQHTGNGGGTAQKGAFKVSNGGEIDLTRIEELNITNSGTALATAVGVDTASTGIFKMQECKINITDPNSTNVVGLAYLGGTGVEHEYYRNTIHVTVTANTGYGFFSSDTATTSRFYYNHLHIVDTGGTSYSYHIGNTSTVISHFDDIVADDGYQLVAGGTFTQVNSETDGSLSLSDTLLINPTSGDPNVLFQIGSADKYCIGVDDTDSDILKITTGASPSAGSELFELSTSAAVFKVNNLTSEYASATTFTQLNVRNTSNANATDSARIGITTNDTRGDTYLLFNPHYASGAVSRFEIGQTQADAFKINHTTDTSSANMTGSTVLTSTTAGEITMPLQPAFLATHNVSQQNVTGNGTNATVNFTTEVFDQNSDYDGTNTFTASVTGSYHFNTSVYVSDVAGGTYGRCFIITSNRTYNGPIQSVEANIMVGALSVLSDMDAADTCIIQGMVLGVGADTGDFAISASNTYFSGNLVC